MLVTHTSPDWDAIGFLWLMRRYDPQTLDMDIAFVNTGAPDLALLAGAYAVGDTGKVYDPDRLRFDHHDVPGLDGDSTCATKLCYSYFYDRGIAEAAIYPIIQLILDGDTGKPGARQSQLTGIHALLKAEKYHGMGNRELAQWGFRILDELAGNLIRYRNAVDMVARHTVYSSNDGRVVALHEAPKECADIALESGADLVLYYRHNERTNGYKRGVLRRPESGIHTGRLIDLAYRFTTDHALIEIGRELEIWYRHGSGFYSGKGTSKAPYYEPMTVSITAIAGLIDGVYDR